MIPQDTIKRRLVNMLSTGYYIPPEYFVFDDRKLIYVSIPKVACTSIKMALLGRDENQVKRGEYMSVHAETSAHLHYRMKAEHQDYFKFAFVRDPFDRLISFYEDKVRTPVQHNDRYFFDSAYNKVLLKRLFGASFRQEMSFAECLALVARTPDFLADGHFKSQSASLYRGSRCLVDYIGKFESLADDWMPIAQRYALSPLSLKNQTTRLSTENYFSRPDLIDLVTRRYAKDIRLFGYESARELLLSKAMASQA